jgi:hypothetical protein
MTPQQLRIGNYLQSKQWGGIGQIEGIEVFEDFWQVKAKGYVHDVVEGKYFDLEPIPISEDVLIRCGYTMIQKSSAGKVWAFVVDGVFSSDLKIIEWKTTERSGKFYRGELEIKGLHHLQNIVYFLTGHELELKK